MRILTESINNLKRNRLLSLATILSIALILVVFNVLISVNFITKANIAELADKMNVSVYLKPETSIEQTNQLATFITSMPEVVSIKQVSKEDALKLVEQKYPESVKFLEEFNVENPLPSSIQIKTKKLEDQSIVRDAITTSQFKDIILKSEIKNKHNQTIEIVVNNLIQIKKFSFQILLWMIITFVIAGGLIIFNAIKTTLYTRRNEIQIMQFVGATYKRIILPFIFEGMLIGLAGFLINLILISILNGFLPFENFKGVGQLSVYILELIISVSIGVLTSLHVVNRYLNTHEIYNE